jgi:two-component system, OmpR family, sensor histidine kinase KdpD
VETPATAALSAANQTRVARHLRLAQELGAATATLTAERPSEAILGYSRAHNVTRIILGKPTHSRLRDLVFGSVLDEVVRGSGDIDVHVISGALRDDPPEEPPERAARPPLSMSPYLWAAVCIAAATAASWMMFRHFDLADLIVVYMLAIVFVAYRFGRNPALLASALSVAAVDFCFVPPYFTFVVANIKHLLTFVGLFVMGVVTSNLTERVRRQAVSARMREERTATLYALARELAQSRNAAEIAAVACRHVFAAAAARGVVVLLPAEGAALVVARSEPPGFDVSERDRSVAAWAFQRREAAGVATSTLPGAEGLYLPLTAASKVVGVLGIIPSDPNRLLDPELRHLLDAICHQIATALRRMQLEEEAHKARLLAEQEALRNALLSSVSHDLRTPLAAITGAASMILESGPELSPVRRELVETIYEEADRLNHLVGDLLDMTRVESGGLALRREWMPLEEVIGAALNRLERALEGREVKVTLPDDLPLLPLDGVLMGQVFFNLLDNAVKYTPAGGRVEVHGSLEDGRCVMRVKDTGVGIEPKHLSRIFERFYRVDKGRSRDMGGTGLGLSIVKHLLGAMEGEVKVESQPNVGSVFAIFLPVDTSETASR